MKIFETKKADSTQEPKKERQSRYQEKIEKIDEISPQQFKQIANETMAEHHHRHSYHHSHHSQSEHHHSSTKKEAEDNLSIDENFDVDRFLAEYQNKLSRQK